MGAKGSKHRFPKTQCIRGHKFTEENTYVNKGHRHCKRCKVLWSHTNAKRISEIFRNFYKRNRDAVLDRNISRAKILKTEVLSYYGKSERLCCCWFRCTVCDVDMLSLDHKNNDGARHRKETGLKGSPLYAFLKRSGYPKGFQTLCFNHQMKKEILRKSRSRERDAKSIGGN